MPQSSPRLFAQLHQKRCQLPWVSGLMLEGVGVAEALALEVDGVDLVAAKPQIPVVAVDAFEDLLPEEGEGGLVELLRGEDAVSVEPGLVAGVDAVQIQ